jgi:hypothetical protein
MTSSRRTLVAALAGVAVLVLVIALVLIGPGDFFLPERATAVNDTADLPSGAAVLKSGTFAGLTGHHVAGTVSLVQDEDGLFLRFENYEQTRGPDVFVFVTPSETPDSKSEIAAGRKVRIDGGADGGESTLVGTFTQRLPDDVDPEDVRGVGVWCEAFSTPFGMATLQLAS